MQPLQTSEHTAPSSQHVLHPGVVGGLETSMLLKPIRKESIQAAKQIGVDISATLPLLQAGLEMRTADKVS